MNESFFLVSYTVSLSTKLCVDVMVFNLFYSMSITRFSERDRPLYIHIGTADVSGHSIYPTVDIVIYRTNTHRENIQLACTFAMKETDDLGRGLFNLSSTPYTEDRLAGSIVSAKIIVGARQRLAQTSLLPKQRILRAIRHT
jgi:hypothetical protein